MANPVELIHQDQAIGAWLYDDHLLIWDLTTKQLCLHNSSATAIWVLLEQPQALESLATQIAELFAIPLTVAKPDVEVCLNDWLARGWVSCNANRLWQIAPKAPTSECLDPRVETVPEHPIFYRQRYRFGDVPFELVLRRDTDSLPTAGTHNFIERLKALCEGFDTTQVVAGEQGFVTLTFDDEGVIVQDNLRPHGRLIAERLALGFIFEAFIRVSYPDRTLGLSLHAAGVKQAHCLALAGISGAGKSTLSAYLATNNWQFFGDDVIVVELKQGQTGPQIGLLPFPLAIGLKQGSWPILESAVPRLKLQPTHPYGEKLAKYIAIGDLPNPGFESNWDAIVLPRYKAGQDTTLMSLTPAQGLQGLLTADMTTIGDQTIESIDQLLRCLSELPGFAIEYSDLEEAHRCLKQIKLS